MTSWSLIMMSQAFRVFRLGVSPHARFRAPDKRAFSWARFKAWLIEGMIEMG